MPRGLSYHQSINHLSYPSYILYFFFSSSRPRRATLQNNSYLDFVTQTSPQNRDLTYIHIHIQGSSTRELVLVLVLYSTRSGSNKPAFLFFSRISDCSIQRKRGNLHCVSSVESQKPGPKTPSPHHITSTHPQSTTSTLKPLNITTTSTPQQWSTSPTA